MVNMDYKDFGKIEELVKNKEVANIRIFSESRICCKHTDGMQVYSAIKFANSEEYMDLVHKIKGTNLTQDIIATSYVRLPDMLLKTVCISGDVCSEGFPCLYIRKLKIN